MKNYQVSPQSYCTLTLWLHNIDNIKNNNKVAFQSKADQTRMCVFGWPFYTLVTLQLKDTENTQNQVMHTAWLTLRKECIFSRSWIVAQKKCSFHMAEGLTPQQQEVETSLDKESDKVWETSRNVQSSKTDVRLVQGCVAVLTARDTCLFCSFLRCPVAVRDFQQCWSDWTQTWLSGY